MLNKFELLTLICTFANDCSFAALKTGKVISYSDETESSYQAIKKALDELYPKTETFNLSRGDFESVLEFLEESETDYLNVNNKYYAEKYDKFRSYLRDKYGHEWE